MIPRHPKPRQGQIHRLRLRSPKFIHRHQTAAVGASLPIMLWRHSGFLSDLDWPDTAALDVFHRQHATFELTIRRPQRTCRCRAHLVWLLRRQRCLAAMRGPRPQPHTVDAHPRPAGTGRPVHRGPHRLRRINIRARLVKPLRDTHSARPPKTNRRLNYSLGDWPPSGRFQHPENQPPGAGAPTTDHPGADNRTLRRTPRSPRAHTHNHARTTATRRPGHHIPGPISPRLVRCIEVWTGACGNRET